MNKPFFLVIEGVDGSGKSTTAIQLAERLGGVYVKSPSRQCQQLWGNFDQHSKSYLARFFFYTMSLCEAAQDIRKYLAAGTSVVADRWETSTILYHEQLLGMDLSTSLKGLNLPRPDFIFILQPSLEVIFERINKREGGHDVLLEQDRNFMSIMYAKYSAFKGATHIDPGGQSVNDVVHGLIETYLNPALIAEVEYA